METFFWDILRFIPFLQQGTLEEGDQLLGANGESLMSCSNDKAVAILKNAAQTGIVKIAFRRDSNSRYNKFTITTIKTIKMLHCTY